MKKLLTLILLFIATAGFAQRKNDSTIIASIYNHCLLKSDCYTNLEYLSNSIGGRVSGSKEAQMAVDFEKKKMESFGFDKVFLQEVMVPHWRRGEKEQASIFSGKTKIEVRICALGGSVATPSKGIKATIVEVHSFKELEALGKEKVAGKIVFFNRPMDPANIETFKSYGGAVDQRGSGANEAAKYGAAGVIVRSMNLRIDKFPHTGAMRRYIDGLPKLPAAAISTFDAELLSKKLKEDPTLQLWYKMNCDTLPDALSYNVIGELRGSEFPNEIILVGGHLDSWDTGDGSHDDGAGCVQSIEVLRAFKQLGIRPRHTIRVVLFMNEENGLRGGKKYAELALQNKEKHIAAIEADAGGFTPRGFDIEADAAVLKKVQSWKPLLEPYGLAEITAGGSGSDIGPLKPQGVPLIGFRPDSQRYFDVHHSAADNFEAINKRELELGAASMAALIYLIDQYGL